MNSYQLKQTARSRRNNAQKVQRPLLNSMKKMKTMRISYFPDPVAQGNVVQKMNNTIFALIIMRIYPHRLHLLHQMHSYSRASCF